MTQNWTLGLIGAGNMGSALIRGVIESNLLSPANISIYDIDTAKTANLAQELKVKVAPSPADLLKQADTIIFASKPQDIHKVLDAIAPQVGPAHLFISIAAGIPLKVIAGRLGPAARLIRVMPNTPAMIGCGATGVARGAAATDADAQRALAIFGSFGLAVEVDESLLDAVTGLSGSGPAYVFYMIEALAAAGEKAGLSPDIAAALTRQTVLGAARMVIETGTNPAELRRRVTSPNGTTEAGLRVMREADFPGIIERTVAAATERGRELGRMFD